MRPAHGPLAPSLYFIEQNADDASMHSVTARRPQRGTTMTQARTYNSPLGHVTVRLPNAELEVVPGVLWGATKLHGSPAHRIQSILCERIEQPLLRPVVKWTLAEALGSLLLEGRGYDGLGRAAHERLCALGAFGKEPPTASQLVAWFAEPLIVKGRTQQQLYPMSDAKAQVLANALQALSHDRPPAKPRAVRDWLVALPGIDHATASFAVSYLWQPHDVAALDDLELLNGRAIGLFPLNWTLAEHYLQLERQWLAFCGQLGIHPSELQSSLEQDAACDIAELERRVESMKRTSAPAGGGRRTTSRARTRRPRDALTTAALVA